MTSGEGSVMSKLEMLWAEVRELVGVFHSTPAAQRVLHRCPHANAAQPQHTIVHDVTGCSVMLTCCMQVDVVWTVRHGVE